MILRAGNGKYLPDMRKKFSEQGCTTIKKITNVQTVCQLMNEIPGAKVLFTELH